MIRFSNYKFLLFLFNFIFLKARLMMILLMLIIIRSNLWLILINLFTCIWLKCHIKWLNLLINSMLIFWIILINDFLLLHCDQLLILIMLVHSLLIIFWDLLSNWLARDWINSSCSALIRLGCLYFCFNIIRIKAEFIGAILI